jgi:hypothetical protein
MGKIFVDYGCGHDGEALTRMGERAAAAMPAGCPAEIRGILLRRSEESPLFCFRFIAEG